MSDGDSIVFSTGATECFHKVEIKMGWKLCRLTMFYGKETCHELSSYDVSAIENSQTQRKNCFIKEAAWSLQRLKRELWCLSYWRLRGRCMELV